MRTPYQEQLDNAERMHCAMGGAHDIATKAREKYGPFASMHEAYGVLAEEVAELFDAVRLRQDNDQRLLMIEREALDVAAVALRIAAEARGCAR